MSTDDPADPPVAEYPTHTGAFGRIVRKASSLPGQGSGSPIEPGSVQGTIRIHDLETSDLMKVSDAELLVLSRLPVRDLQNSVAIEIARRNIAAISTSTDALGQLRASVNNLLGVTEAANMEVQATLGQLNGRLDLLRTSTDAWSRWLTRLTIAVVGLTALLVVLAIAQKIT